MSFSPKRPGSGDSVFAIIAACRIWFWAVVGMYAWHALLLAVMAACVVACRAMGFGHFAGRVVAAASIWLTAVALAELVRRSRCS